MSKGPLRRPVAVLGLLVLLPTAWMTATGQLGAADAGIRALATLLAVLLVNRVANWGVRRTNRTLARDAILQRANEAAAQGRAGN